MLKSKPINLEEIDREIQNYLTIRQKSVTLLNFLPADAKRYYVSDEIAFIFEKTDLEYLFAKYPHANGLKAYYGAHHGEQGTENGQPTMILIACDIQYLDGEIKTTNFIKEPGDFGIQWPDGVRIGNSIRTPSEFTAAKDDWESK